MKDRIKKLRKALGIKQRQLAERLEVDTSVIGKWEAGSQPVPKTRVYQICNEYGVSREWLETGAGDMFAPEAQPVTVDEQLEASARSLFNELSPRGQAAVLRVLAEMVSDCASGKETDAPPDAAAAE